MYYYKKLETRSIFLQLWIEAQRNHFLPKVSLSSDSVAPWVAHSSCTLWNFATTHRKYKPLIMTFLGHAKKSHSKGREKTTCKGKRVKETFRCYWPFRSFDFSSSLACSLPVRKLNTVSALVRLVKVRVGEIEAQNLLWRCVSDLEEWKVPLHETVI